MVITEIQGVIDKLKDLPSLPQIITKIIEMTDDPNVTATELNKVISMDQALSSKILKLVNSAFYGFPKKIENLNQAVVILGFKTIRSLALGISIIDMFSSKKAKEELDYPALWKHSIAVATLSKFFAQKYFPQIAEESFTAGLLHDIGILILDQYFKDNFSKVYSSMLENKIPLYEAEKNLLGYSHADVGKLVAEKWNFPNTLIKAIAFHHGPIKEDEHFNIIATVHASDIGTKLLRYGKVGDEQFIRLIHLNEDVKRLLRLSPDFPQDLRDTILKILKEGESIIPSLIKG